MSDPRMFGRVFYKHVVQLNDDWAASLEWFTTQLHDPARSEDLVALQEVLASENVPVLDAAQWKDMSKLANLAMRELARRAEQRRRDGAS